jgi:hypothetical protein
MNERIRELRFLAADYANDQKPLGTTKWQEIRDEKFAELIVRECLDEIQYDDGATHVDELLPKHFGFEL